MLSIRGKHFKPKLVQICTDICINKLEMREKKGSFSDLFFIIKKNSIQFSAAICQLFWVEAAPVLIMEAAF